MNGVTILAEYIYRGTPLIGVILTGILAVFVFCVVIYGIYMDYKDSYQYKKIRILIRDVFLSIFVMGIVVLFVAVIHNDYTTMCVNYEVRVDDSVSLNEFINNYEIISYDGDVYTVREIEE